MTEPTATPAPLPPTEGIVEKIDRLILEKAPQIVEKMRQIRSNEGIQFQGMTRARINEEFTINITGVETYRELQEKISQLNTLYNRAITYLTDMEDEYTLATNYIDEFVSKLDREIIVGNLTNPNTKDRISDKARESLVRKVYEVENIGELFATINVEISHWKAITKRLDKTFEKIHEAMICMSSENKYSGNTNPFDTGRPRQ